MGQAIREIMTPNPITLDAGANVREAARKMRDEDIGDVLVTQQGRIRGIVTDRDIVVRCVADDGALDERTIGELCSGELVSLRPDAAIGDAIRLMEEHAVRRIPVIEDGRAVGIVSLGDLAVARDRDSALGKISSAPPQD